MTSVLVIAASPALRAGLRALLYEEGLTPTDAVPTIEAAAALVPADVWLVADDQLELINQPFTLGEGSHALVLLSDDPQAARRLQDLALRGWALLPVDVGGSELKAAIEAAAQGLVVLPLDLSHLLIDTARFGRADELPFEPLTPRENEVLTLIGQGLPNKLIARELSISEHTVKFHTSSIFAKLGASSRTDAVSRGARAGLIVL